MFILNTPSLVYATRGIHFLVQQVHGFVASAELLIAARSAPKAKAS
ncbi:hypothetical protein [Variovorax rhizosphaerae]|uniref:Uncharacterized protein n=1 Tax=Variovorax rhizosphaerae TaxID=1836200 RepID=A0ABU8WDT7_9BURK